MVDFSSESARFPFSVFRQRQRVSLFFLPGIFHDRFEIVPSRRQMFCGDIWFQDQYRDVPYQHILYIIVAPDLKIHAGQSGAPKVRESRPGQRTSMGRACNNGFSSKQNNTSPAPPKTSTVTVSSTFGKNLLCTCRFLFNNSLPHIPKSCIQNTSLRWSFSLQ